MFALHFNSLRSFHFYTCIEQNVWKRKDACGTLPNHENDTVMDTLEEKSGLEIQSPKKCWTKKNVI